MTRISTYDRIALYGPITQYPTGPGVVSSLIEPVRTSWGVRTVAHRLVAGHFAATLERAVKATGWVPARIDGFNPRAIRGTVDTPSMHAYALAWDLFDRPYPQPVDVWGPTNAPPDAFLQVFRDAGFRVGADFTGRKDYPHIEWAGTPPTPITTEPDMPLTEADKADIRTMFRDELNAFDKRTDTDADKQLRGLDARSASRTQRLLDLFKRPTGRG